MTNIEKEVKKAVEELTKSSIIISDNEFLLFCEKVKTESENFNLMKDDEKAQFIRSAYFATFHREHTPIRKQITVRQLIDRAKQIEAKYIVN